MDMSIQLVMISEAKEGMDRGNTYIKSLRPAVVVVLHVLARLLEPVDFFCGSRVLHLVQ